MTTPRKKAPSKRAPAKPTLEQRVAAIEEQLAGQAAQVTTRRLAIVDAHGREIIVAATDGVGDNATLTVGHRAVSRWTRREDRPPASTDEPTGTPEEPAPAPTTPGEQHTAIVANITGNGPRVDRPRRQR